MIPIDLHYPVVGRSLIGREDWVHLFIDNFANKPKTVGAAQYALVAPRRTGKTSILLEIFNRLFYDKAAGPDMIPLFFNLEEILIYGDIPAFPELYLLQLYSCIFNFRIGKTVYSYQDLKIPRALELSKTYGFHEYLVNTLDMMEYDRSRGIYPAFRVVALPGEISRETGQAFAVLVDETQEALRIYKEKGVGILMAYRNCWDHFSMKKSCVYHIFTGSAASLMSKEVLGGESCLFGRIYHKDLSPLKPPAVNQLVDFHTDGPVPVWSNEARTALYEMTGGHPFYTKCLVRNLLEQNLSLIEVSHVNAAYKNELSAGIIYKTLKDDFSRYLSRYKDPDLLEQILKRLVDCISENGSAPSTVLHSVPRWDSQAAKYLEDCDIIRFNAYVRFEDPVFRDWFKHIYWVYVKDNKQMEDSDLDLSGSTAHRLLHDIGFLFQRLVRMALSFFNGQAAASGLFGQEGQDIILPVVTSTSVEWTFYWPSYDRQEEEYRFDVMGRAESQIKPGEKQFWIVECKYWDSKQVGISQVKSLLHKEQKFKQTRVFSGRVIRWFCSKNKLKPAVQEFCRKHDIYFSSAHDVDQLIQQLRQSK